MRTSGTMAVPSTLILRGAQPRTSQTTKPSSLRGSVAFSSSVMGCVWPAARRNRSCEHVTQSLSSPGISIVQTAATSPVFSSVISKSLTAPTAALPKSTFFCLNAQVASSSTPETASSRSALAPGTWACSLAAFGTPCSGVHVTSIVALP